MHGPIEPRAVLFASLVLGLMSASSACSEKPEGKPAQKPAAAPAATATPAKQPAAEPIGRQVYANNCASCHGETGRGDGPMAQFLATPPRGLVSEPWRTFPASSESEERKGLESAVRQGFPDRGMPAYSTRLTDEQISAVVDQVLAMRGAAQDK